MVDIGRTLRKILRKPITLSEDGTLVELETMILQDKLDEVITKLEKYEQEGYHSSDSQEIFFKKHYSNFLKCRAYVDRAKPMRV